MKNKNTKIGLIAALSGLATISGCQSNKPIVANDKNVDSIRLEKRLTKLSNTKNKGPLAFGAMCYMMAEVKNVDYVCSHCNNTIPGRYSNAVIGDINYIERIVAEIQDLGYDVILDKTEYCPNCSKKTIFEPKLIFKIRFSNNTDYHIVKTNIVNEYKCLLAFLSNQDKYKGDYGREFPLHDNIDIIQKMTGLGEDLKIKND